MQRALQLQFSLYKGMLDCHQIYLNYTLMSLQYAARKQQVMKHSLLHQTVPEVEDISVYLIV